MQVHNHIPIYPLSNFIKHIVYVSGSLPLPQIKELPEGGINLVIELNENTINTIHKGKTPERDLSVKHAWISGMQKKAIIYNSNPDSTILSVRFTAGGFYALTKIPITTINNVGIEAETLLGNSFKYFYQQLINTDAIQDKFSLVETYFLEYSVNEGLEYDIVKFINQNLDKSIDWLVRKSGYSQKHVIHILKKHTGFSPKYLKRIHRFHKVVNQIQRQKECIDWFSIIQRFGYYDQAHLIKDFSHFAGLSPSEYLVSQVTLEENSLVPDMILKFPKTE